MAAVVPVSPNITQQTCVGQTIDVGLGQRELFLCQLAKIGTMTFWVCVCVVFAGAAFAFIKWRSSQGSTHSRV